MFNDFSDSSLKNYFVDDFFLCQEKFLQAINDLEQAAVDFVEQKQWQLENSQLMSNAVYIGKQHASKVLVLISGTHGVEGYCGSAIQRFLLAKIHQQQIKLPTDTALITLHALNPWGMFWARRCDHQGIDVNRNFIDFSQLSEKKFSEKNSDYQQVLDFLNMSDSQQRRQKMHALVAEWGQVRFDEVFSGGQYQSEWAPFYGGRQASFSQGIINDVINTWHLGEREVFVIDLHTGLGPWAYGEIISDHPAASQANHFAKQLFGAALAITEMGESFSVKKAGLLDYRWHQLMQTQGCFVTLEFGTYGTDALFETLLNEHLFWRDHSPSGLHDAAYLQQRKAMMNHFFPNDNLWQQAVLFKAWQVVQKVLVHYA